MGFCCYCDYCCSFWIGELLDCNSIWGENGGMYENFDGFEPRKFSYDFLLFFIFLMVCFDLSDYIDRWYRN